MAKFNKGISGTSAPFHIDEEQVRISMGDMAGLHELSWAYAGTVRRDLYRISVSLMRRKGLKSLFLG